MEKEKRKGKPRLNPVVEVLLALAFVFISFPLTIFTFLFIDNIIDTLFTAQQLRFVWGTLTCLVCCMGPGFLIAIIVYPAYWYQQTFGPQGEPKSKQKPKHDDEMAES
ncbi:MAG: hypothetical protein KC708_15525 [Anaerolineae bacterium]|nr:hypothetical protein [Anaerolineae bacterium]